MGNKKYFLAFFCLCSLMFAQGENSENKSNIINAIAIVVDKEPITTYDIQILMKEQNIDKQRAVANLVNDRLEKAQVKKLGILISEYELNNEIQKFLAQNNLSLDQLKARLKVDGVEYEKFKKDFKDDLLKRKLYEAVSAGAKVDFSESGARQFYESHLNEFIIYTDISADIFSSVNSNALELFVNSGTKSKAIHQRSVHISPQNTDPRLLNFLSSLPVSQFSPLIQGNEGFVVYRVRSKSGAQQIGFDEAKEAIIGTYVNKQREDFVKDYFDKARAKAQIQVIRE